MTMQRPITDAELTSVLRGASQAKSLPPSVLDSVHAATQTQPQRARRWWPAPKWSFRPMFSATKFVVAVVIVALFGGFLLAGVLTTQQGEEPLPAGASTSASPDPTLTTDLLPGVGLVTEEVQPGVFRVLGDGEHDLRQDVYDVAVTPDGTVWVEKHTPVTTSEDIPPRNSRVLQLGRRGVVVKNGAGVRARLFFVALHDGTVILSRTNDDRDPLVLDGQEWVETTNPAVEACAGTDSFDGMLTADGACWLGTFEAIARGRGSGITDNVAAARIDASGEERFFTYDDLGIDRGRGFYGPFTGYPYAAADDGTIWTEYREPDLGFAGLLGFDGETWAKVLFDGNTDLSMADLAVTPDGGVWVALRDPSVTTPAIGIVSWDGDAWTSHGTVEADLADPARFHVASNGTVWFGGLARIDGTAIGRIDLPFSLHTSRDDGPDIAHAPDGSIWIASDGLYVIRPEVAMAAE